MHLVKQSTGNCVWAEAGASRYVCGVMASAETFYPLAQAFELLATRLDHSDSPERRKSLLKRMRVVIDEIDELLLREAVNSSRKPQERIHANHGIEKVLKSPSKARATIAP
jgi:hypothetical protein